MRSRASFVLATLVVGYGAFYLCRANVEAAFPALTLEFGFKKAQLGALSSAAVAVYAVGKVLMGSLGDVIGGKRLMLLAIAGSVAASLAFGASHTLPAFVLFACVNRFFQSGGWSGAVHVVAQRFDARRRGLVMGVMSTSYELGNVAALLLSGQVVALFAGWRALFVVNPLLLGAVGAYLAIALVSPSSAPAPRGSRSLPSALPPPDAAPETGGSFWSTIAHLARQPAFHTAVTLSALLTFLRIVFLNWTPLYLTELARAAGDPSIPASIAKSAAFPAAGVVAALVVGPITDRLGPGRRAPAMAVSLAGVVVLALALGHGGVHSPRTAAILIGGVGLFLLGPYSLLAGAIALDVSGKRGAATAAGVIDSAGYFVSFAAGAPLGAMTDRLGWSAAFDVVAAVALAATLLAAVWAVVAVRRRPPMVARRPEGLS